MSESLDQWYEVLLMTRVALVLAALSIFVAVVIKLRKRSRRRRPGRLIVDLKSTVARSERPHLT